MLALTLCASQKFVVVPHASALYLAPETSAMHVTTPKSTPDAVEEHFWVFARAGEPHDGWLPIESDPDVVSDPGVASDAGYHCYSGPPGLDGLRLRFYVRTDAVSAVTQKRVHAGFKDGSGVELLPGVAVAPHGREADVALDGLRFKMPIARDAIGDSYEANPRAFTAPPDAGAVPGDDVLLLDGKPVDLDHALFSLQLTASSTRSGHKLDIVESGCAMYRFAARPQTGPVNSVGGFGILGTLAGDRTVIAAGAKAYWQDGSEAGVARYETTAPPVELPSAHGRRCFAFGLRALLGAERGELPVCFDAASVSVHKAQSTRGLFARPDGGR